MPLLGKKEFAPQPNATPLPDEVYYNEITNEIFTNYETYLRRVEELSQPQWTCSITGKTGLTYNEAIECEDAARQLVHSIPTPLRKVMAILMTHIKVNSTPLAQHLLFVFTELRYFIGEEVQLISPGRRRDDVTILRVIPPEQESETKGTFAYGLNPLSFEYIVESENDEDEIVELRVPASRLTRHKGKLTQSKIRLFLKVYTSLQKGKEDRLVLNDEIIDELKINKAKWTDIFAGAEPNFVSDTTMIKALGKKEAAENLDSEDDEEECKKTKPIVLKKKSNILSAAKKKLQERNKKEKTAEKSKKKKEKEKEKEEKEKAKKKKKEEKEKMTPEDKEKQKEIAREARKDYEDALKVWSEKRDDLLCDDLKPLPEPWEVKVDLDSGLLKQVFMVTEFVNTFSSFITGFQDYFPDGVSFQMMLEMLQESEVGGNYGTLVQLIFSTVLSANCEDGRKDSEDMKIDNNLEMDVDVYTDSDNVSENLVTNLANNWVTTYFNTHDQLAKLKLDQFTISELLRIYIFKAREVDPKTFTRPPMSDMESRIVRSLAVKNFVELDLEERLELFNLLIQDFFTIPDIIEKIEDTNQTIYRLKIEIRHLNAAHTKWLREHPIRNRIRKKKSTENGTVSEDASPEEKEAYRVEKMEREAKLDEEIGSMKAQIRKLSLFSREFCLGEDRLFRKYWIFEYIPGVFVEHMPIEQLEFPCLDDPEPLKKPVMADFLESAAKRSKSASRKATKNNISSNNSSKNNNSIHKDDGDIKSDSMDRCSGNIETCRVHGKARHISKPLWSVYTDYQLDSLIEALNQRGNRESELRTALEYEKKSILENNFANFDASIYNADYQPPEPEPEPEPEEEVKEEEEEILLLENETRKSARIIRNAAIERANAAKAAKEAKIEKVEKMETRRRKVPKLIAAKYQSMDSIKSHLSAFCDELSEFADRIVAANFSTFDDTQWIDWREELYTCQENLDSYNSTVKTLVSLFKNIAISLKSFCLLPPLVVTLESSNSHSPSDKENIEQVEPTKENVISDKWLELLKMISQDDEQDDMESSYGLSSVSQLFVNYCILDRSINWDLSAEKTASRCKHCKRRIGVNGDRVICDRCNRGYHPTCLKIRSTDELKRDWICFDCSPKNGQPQPVVNVESEDMELYEKCGSCNYTLKANERDIVCRDCNKTFHLHCSGLNRAPRGAWNCKKCVTKQKRRKESQDLEMAVDHEVRRSGRKRRVMTYSDDDEDYEYLAR